ncbi:hypothetical protein RN001_012225 [Aquatica leii]|uniref:Uncharacterized protein n=1 Tax=Aquatica leii TaxID=1421715 RepID=A0AAN7SMD0_9COLE|nr:hypothetical protein RN001_012225 [Aquatica leii]
MFALVKFISDNVFYVCKSDDIQLSKRIKCRVKWIDGYYYSAVTICKHDCDEVLQDIQNNLEQNFPIVVLKRHELSEHNFCVEAIESKNVYACIEQNTSTHHQFEQSPTVNNFHDNLAKDILNCNINVLSISPTAHTFANDQFNVDTASPGIEVDAASNTVLVQDVATTEFVNVVLNDPDLQVMDFFGSQLESPGLRNSLNVTNCDIASLANPSQIECTEILHCSELLSPESIVPVCSTTENDVPLLSESSKKRKNVYTPFAYNRDVVITPSYTDHVRSDVNKKLFLVVKKKDAEDTFVYIAKLYAKLSQHLEWSHRDETAVRMFLSLPTKNIERRKIIETIRRRGDFDYNTSLQNESGELLVARRSHSGFMRESKHYLPCPHCAAFFCKDTLRLHIRTCLPPTKKVEDGKTVKHISRAFLSNVHPMASEILKTKIFPVMRDDEFVNVVRYDQLAISFGNFMCSKYVSQHHHDMIRSRLRFIGRLLITAKTLDQTVKDFANLLTPSKFDVVVEAIKRIGGINEDSTSYRAPTTVLHLSTICKQACRIWKSECIKNGDANGKQNVDDFLSLFNATFPAALGRTALENRVEHQRQKIVELPTSADIKKLVGYLREQRRKWLSIVKGSKVTNLEYAVKQLASFTLVSLLVFNRRRPGELERITLNDFKSLRSAQSISAATGHAYNEEETELLKRYKRFEIRGKLNRTVPVLVDYEMESCINLIIANRRNRCEG